MEFVDQLGDQFLGCSVKGPKHEAVDAPCCDS